MNAKPALTAVANERLTWENDIDFDFGTAVVLAHHKIRKAASPDVKAAFGSHDEVGCFWTGEVRAPVPRFVVP
jgi:hypothetical protein